MGLAPRCSDNGNLSPELTNRVVLPAPGAPIITYQGNSYRNCWSRLPFDAVQLALEGAGVPAVVSYSAGLYVCNDLFYRFLAYAEARPDGPGGGFVHVPPLPVEGKPGMDIDCIVTALRITLSTALDA